MCMDSLFKLTCEMLDAIEEWMKQDDETTVAQLMKMLGEHGLRSRCARSREPGRHWGGL